MAQNPHVDQTSLPQTIPPYTLPFTRINAAGNAIIDQTWYLFLYNLFRIVIQNGGGSGIVGAVGPAGPALLFDVGNEAGEDFFLPMPGPMGPPGIPGTMVNFSTSAQSPAATVRTYINGSGIVIPAGFLQVGSCFRWTISITKTAAGSSSSTFDIAFGTTGTVADTAQVSFTKPAGTADADEGTIVITAVCRGPIGASGVVTGQFHMSHNLAATGHATIPVIDVNTISAGFDITTPTNIGICITSGAADAITHQLVFAESWNI